MAKVEDLSSLRRIIIPDIYLIYWYDFQESLKMWLGQYVFPGQFTIYTKIFRIVETRKKKDFSAIKNPNINENIVFFIS